MEYTKDDILTGLGFKPKNLEYLLKVINEAKLDLWGLFDLVEDTFPSETITVNKLLYVAFEEIEELVKDRIIWLFAEYEIDLSDIDTGLYVNYTDSHLCFGDYKIEPRMALNLTKEEAREILQKLNFNV